MDITHHEMIEVLSQVPLFSDLTPYELKRYVGLFQPVLVKAGDFVFGNGGPSDAAYIIFDGKIRLLDDVDDDSTCFAIMKIGDIFGEEALLYDDPRDYSAFAVNDAILLRLDINNFIFILDSLPNAETLLDVSIASRKLANEVLLPWLHEDEYVHVITRRHPFILFSKLLPPILSAIGVVILAVLIQWVWLPERFFGWLFLLIGLPPSALWIIWSYADWRNDYFIVTNKRVVWIEKIMFVYESRQEAPMRTIMSVGVSRSRLGSLLGYGDVVVTTYVGTIRLREIANTETTAKLVETYWKQSDLINRREEAKLMQKKLHEKLNLPLDEEDNTIRTYQPQSEAKINRVKEPSFLTWLFSDFIRLRYEQDGEITYRKHWFILIQHIWLAILLMIGVFAVGLLRLSGKISFLPATPFILVTIFSMFVIFLWMLYIFEDWRNDVFMVTDDQIVDLDRKPLGKVRRRSAPLENILSIEYERRGIWGYLFNFGTVFIDVGATKLSFDHVYHPSKVQEDIFYRMGERLERKRQFELETERERVSEWIASYHRKTGGIHNIEPNHPQEKN